MRKARLFQVLSLFAVLCVLAALAGCSGADGTNGANGAPGTDGTGGTPGANGGDVAVSTFHGASVLRSNAKKSGKVFATATITSATAAINGSVTVNFSVEDDAGGPVSTVPAVSANIAKLVPAGGGESFSKWVPYIYRTRTVSGSADGDWPNPDGTAAEQGYRESNGTLTNHGNGSYTYAFSTNISSVVTPVTAATVTYDRTLTHRVSIMMGGSTGATADAYFDFVPNGSSLPMTRAIVDTSACRQCHGGEFHGHDGDRTSVENCVTCHAPGSADPYSGETLDFKVMIHKIHAGGELASIPGPDGIVWDNPVTGTDESADNGQYAIWDSQKIMRTWWKSDFPAMLANCTKCHQGAGGQVDNWKNVPSRAVCGSCHDTVDFNTGANHPGGAQANDTNCGICHPPSGFAIGQSVTDGHDWTSKDPRNIPEFTANLTVTVPMNGVYFVAGETPVITLVLSEGSTTLDHNTIAEDSTAEGCLSSGCPPRDGLFRGASLFVHGPRGNRMPVLTTSARAQILSTSTGPYNISGAGGTLALQLDGGEDITAYDVTGGDYMKLGTITVPVSSGTFAGGSTAATPAEVVVWLNGNTSFSRRAIAFISPAGGVGIRSRNLGRVHSLQLQSGVVTTAVFGGDVTIHLPPGSTTANNISKRINPANDDPKTAWSPGAITYTLDPVDDLAPGTYIVSIELTDRGRIDANNYSTPTVAKLAFQVKTATPELQVAGNCASCHQSAGGKGLVLDYSRHNKILDNTAVDQCGACHDYQPQTATGTSWSGARPIAKRVHAVHNGAALVTPLATVDYANGDPVAGRNWNITYPQSVLQCETCHPEGTTSGTWKTKAARIPCMGCHDSNAAKTHMMIMISDPTDTNPWSGDEAESCTVCH